MRAEGPQSRLTRETTSGAPLDIFLQQLINGLTLGSVYAMVALGYTMVYGILELINFAHGEVVMLGALIALAVLGVLAGSGLPAPLVLALAIACAVPICVATGFVIERVAYRPLRNAPRLAPLITAIGVSIVLQNIAMILWGRQYVSFPPVIDLQIYELAGATLTNLQIAIFVVAAAIMGMTACAAVGPDYVPPESNAPASWNTPSAFSYSFFLKSSIPCCVRI